MKYLGYEIEYEYDHVIVTAPNGHTWTEDTMEDAMGEIRTLVSEEKEV